MGETCICQVRATVLTYDDASKSWVPVGSEEAIVSHVRIYHHPEANTFRVVGRKLQADQEVVINCPITKGMKHNLASPHFFQMRDSRQFWGLNFGSKDDGPLFSDSIKYALETLANGNNTVQDGQRQEQRGVTPVASPTSAPAAPPIPPTPPAPPPKEVPASRAAGAPPPPPGPPPPPAPAPPPAPPPPGAAPAGHSVSEEGGGGGGGGGLGGDLAAALAGAKLRKAPRKEEDASSPSKEAPASGGGGGGGGGGLMGEMSAILARRRKVSDLPAVKKDETGNEGSDSPQSKPSRQNESFVKPKEKSTTLPRPKPAMNQREPSISTTFSQTKMKNMKTNPESPTNDIDMKQFKQDILLEVKKELHKVKEEIISALIGHLQASEV